MKTRRWLKEATRDLRRRKAFENGRVVTFLSCPLCGLNKKLGKSEIHAHADGFIYQVRIGGGSFNLEEDAPAIWQALCQRWGRTGPRPKPKMSLGFFLDESRSVKLEDLQEHHPDLFEALKRAVEDLCRQFEAVCR